MPTIKTEYTVFVSSPSDLNEERQVVQDVVKQVNKLRAHRSSVTLKTLTWEDDVVPSFGQKPQAIINDATKDQYDIFLGFMCSRFGTETDNAGSGTEEEFQIAYEKKISAPTEIEVLFYFKDVRQSKTEIDVEQFAKVDKFRKSLELDYAGMYGKFETEDEFKTQITLHLTKILDNFEKKPRPKSNGNQKPIKLEQQKSDNKITNPLALLIEVIIDESEEVFFEQTNALVESSDNVIRDLKPVTDLVLDLDQSTRSGTAQLNTLNQSGPAKRNKTKKVLESIADQMEYFVEESKILLPPLHGSLEIYLESFRDFFVVIGHEKLSGNKDITALAGSIVEMLSGIKTAADSFEKLGLAASSLPRMTKRLNAVKKQVAAIADGISKMLNSAHTQLAALAEPLVPQDHNLLP
ncbi:MAG: DUF4062 domain-containing protein [Rhodobacteraceae bacterium]|nr:DUF4062 domain-containing protein [Paracoccaceae bacterium]